MAEEEGISFPSNWFAARCLTMGKGADSHWRSMLPPRGQTHAGWLPGASRKPEPSQPTLGLASVRDASLLHSFVKEEVCLGEGHRGSHQVSMHPYSCRPLMSSCHLLKVAGTDFWALNCFFLKLTIPQHFRWGMG